MRRHLERGLEVLVAGEVRIAGDGVDDRQVSVQPLRDFKLRIGLSEV